MEEECHKKNISLLNDPGYEVEGIKIGGKVLYNPGSMIGLLIAKEGLIFESTGI